MDCGDANKTRRFYFSYRESRCKRFGICAQAALQYDEVTEINYFSSMAECEANCTNGKDVIILQLADLHLYLIRFLLSRAVEFLVTGLYSIAYLCSCGVP